LTLSPLERKKITSDIIEEIGANIQSTSDSINTNFLGTEKIGSTSNIGTNPSGTENITSNIIDTNFSGIENITSDNNLSGTKDIASNSVIGTNFSGMENIQSTSNSVIDTNFFGKEKIQDTNIDTSSSGTEKTQFANPSGIENTQTPSNFIDNNFSGTEKIHSTSNIIDNNFSGIENTQSTSDIFDTNMVGTNSYDTNSFGKEKIQDTIQSTSNIFDTNPSGAENTQPANDTNFGTETTSHNQQMLYPLIMPHFQNQSHVLGQPQGILPFGLYLNQFRKLHLGTPIPNNVHSTSDQNNTDYNEDSQQKPEQTN